MKLTEKYANKFGMEFKDAPPTFQNREQSSFESGTNYYKYVQKVHGEDFM